MALFDDMLSSGESLLKNEVALDYDYMPKLIPHREKEQKYIAQCIKPLFSKINGKNLLIYGAPGVGKTVASKHVIKEIEETTDDVIPIYINCWQRNTTFKIFAEICEQLDYKFTHNKKTDELFRVVKNVLNKKSVVFVFDEIDKVEDFDFLYTILEELYRKSIVLITNYREWLLSLEQRVRSRLNPDTIEFKPYNKAQTTDILKQRRSYAFVPGVWEDDAFNLIVDNTAELEDIRCGLHLMKESAFIAENRSSKKIILEDAEKSLDKLDEFSTKKDSELDSDLRFILALIKKNSGKKIGELHKIYLDAGGNLGYRTFQRKINSLSENKFITVERITGGKEGNTSIVKFAGTKKLTEF